MAREEERVLKGAEGDAGLSSMAILTAKEGHARRCHRAAPCVARYACVVFDFDSTLSSPVFLQRFGRWAIADKPKILSAMTKEEIVANFGGHDRLCRLRKMMSALAEAHVHMLIISIGFKKAQDSWIQGVCAVGVQ